MKTLLSLTTLFLLLLLFPLTSESQTYCSNLGTVIVCNGYDGNQTTIAPLGRTGGVITQDDYRGHSSLSPYSILEAPSRPGSGIEPLRELEPLPDTRLPDPFADEARSPFDLGPGDGLMLGQ